MGFTPTTTSSQQRPDAVSNQKWSRRHTCWSLFWTSSHLHQKVRNKICGIQCNTSTYSETFFPSVIRLRNTLPVDICSDLNQLSPGLWTFRSHALSFPGTNVCTFRSRNKTAYSVGSWSARSPVCPLNWLTVIPRFSPSRRPSVCLSVRIRSTYRKIRNDPYPVKSLNSSIKIASEGPLLSKLL